MFPSKASFASFIRLRKGATPKREYSAVHSANVKPGATEEEMTELSSRFGGVMIANGDRSVFMVVAGQYAHLSTGEIFKDAASKESLTEICRLMGSPPQRWDSPLETSVRNDFKVADIKSAIHVGYDWYGCPLAVTADHAQHAQDLVTALIRVQGKNYPAAYDEAKKSIAEAVKSAGKAGVGEPIQIHAGAMLIKLQHEV